jgi:hypothetical protein
LRHSPPRVKTNPERRTARAVAPQVAWAATNHDTNQAASLLFFRLEFAIVLANERFNIGGARKNSKPLFLLSSDGETSHSIERNSALLTDLQAQPDGALVFKPSILSPQPFHLCSHLRFAHSVSPNRYFMSTSLLHQLTQRSKAEFTARSDDFGLGTSPLRFSGEHGLIGIAPILSLVSSRRRCRVAEMETPHRVSA